MQLSGVRISSLNAHTLPARAWHQLWFSGYALMLLWQQLWFYGSSYGVMSAAMALCQQLWRYGSSYGVMPADILIEGLQALVTPMQPLVETI